MGQDSVTRLHVAGSTMCYDSAGKTTRHAQQQEDRSMPRVAYAEDVVYSSCVSPATGLPLPFVLMKVMALNSSGRGADE